MTNNENFPLFVHWLNTLDWVMDTAERLPQKVRFTLANRIVDLSLDILEHIIEAIYSRKRREILQCINLKLEKLRILFRICHQRRYLSSKQLQHISSMLNEAGKMSGGWLKTQDQ